TKPVASPVSPPSRPDLVKRGSPGSRVGEAAYAASGIASRTATSSMSGPHQLVSLRARIRANVAADTVGPEGVNPLLSGRRPPGPSLALSCMPTAVVTGGAGFLGSHLCDHLLSTGHRVICVDNLLTSSLANIEHIRDDGFSFL